MNYYLILAVVILILIVIAIWISHQTTESAVLSSDMTFTTDTNTLRELAMVPFQNINIPQRLHGANPLGMYNMSVHKYKYGYSGVIRGSSIDGCCMISDAPLYSYTYYISLDNTGGVLDTRLLDLDYNNMINCSGKCGHETNGTEDPKLFIYRGEQWVVVNVLGSDKQADVCKNVMCIFTVAKPRETFRILKVPDNVNPKQAQKNWSFFEYKGDLFCEYSISPHVILKVDTTLGTTTEAYRSGNSGIDVVNFKSLRGGANAIKTTLNGKSYYLNIGHITSHGDYQQFFYLFNCEPPFEIIEVAKPYKLDHKARIQFAAGISEYQDRIYVSYGISDCYNRISIFNKDKIMSLFHTFE